MAKKVFLILGMGQSMNGNGLAPVLIVAQSGRRRDSLQAVLKTIPRLKIIGQVDEELAVLKLIIIHHPAMVLLDVNLPGDRTWGVLKQIKTEWPQMLCLVLVDTVDQQQIAQAAGADGVLVSEMSLSKFYATIEKLLPTQNSLELKRSQR